MTEGGSETRSVISKTAYVNAEASDRAVAHECEGLEDLGAAVVAQAEGWIEDGVGEDVGLALVQNALPLIEGSAHLSRLQRRSHAQALLGLLLLLDDPMAGGIATELVELLHGAAADARVLAS
jgi:hypothetical protein